MEVKNAKLSGHGVLLLKYNTVRLIYSGSRGCLNSHGGKISRVGSFIPKFHQRRYENDKNRVVLVGEGKIVNFLRRFDFVFNFFHISRSIL